MPPTSSASLPGMGPIPADTLAALKEQHGEKLAHLVSQTGVELLAIPPSRVQWKRYRQQSFDVSKREFAVETLFKSVVVYPEAADLEKLLDRWVGIPEEFADDVQALAGVTGETEAKKP